jgi:hypothetical protein
MRAKKSPSQPAVPATRTPKPTKATPQTQAGLKSAGPAGEPTPVVPLAPFNLLTPFELAVVAALLSKGRNPAKHFSTAASLWAEAYEYLEFLNDLYWGKSRLKVDAWKVLSLGTGDEWVDVNTACAMYSWGRRHLRDLLKDFLLPHIFRQLWKPHTESIRLPKLLLEKLDKLQAQKRSSRSKRSAQKRLSSP